jgi:hypothetical protein
MSILRPLGAEDLLKINAVNIDAWTETVSNFPSWLYPVCSNFGLHVSIRPLSTCSISQRGPTILAWQRDLMAEESTHTVSWLLLEHYITITPSEAEYDTFK